MFAKAPPPRWVQVQTVGGLYSGESVMFRLHKQEVIRLLLSHAFMVPGLRLGQPAIVRRGAAEADGTPARPYALARCSTSCIIDAKSQGEPDCGSGLIHAHRRRRGSRAPRVGDRAPR